jgi:hypothetical protein
MASRDVRNFYEVRAGLEGMQEFAAATLAWMDESGLAIQKKKYKAKASSNGHAPINVEALRETAKKMFKKRRGPYKTKTKPTKKSYKLKNTNKKLKREAADPDGLHVTMPEAAKMLKMSDANVRFMCNDGRLPKPTYEKRPWSKKEPDRVKVVQVIPVDAVKAYKAAEASA